MIVAPTDEEAKHLDRCLESVAPYVDSVWITVTGSNEAVERVCGKWEANVSHFGWTDDFSAAREFNASQVKADWYLWLDADDTLAGAERLHDLVDECERGRINGCYLRYQYSFDGNGNCVDDHWKLQLARNDGHWRWKGAIHEDMLPNGQARWVKSPAIGRIHHAEGGRPKASIERNLRILLREAERDPKEPRTKFYLGRTYLALGECQKAVDVLFDYLSVSGWDDERYEARILIGNALVKTGQLDEALKSYNDAILEKEEYPDAYVQKATAYLMKGEWNKALYNYKTSLGMAEPEGATYHNPMQVRRDVYVGISACYLNLGMLAEADRAVRAALKADPKFKEALELRAMIDPELAKLRVRNGYVTIAKALMDSKQEQKILPLLHSFPREMADDEVYLSLAHTYLKPKEWPEKSIAVYCGATAEPWRPGDEDGKGIGGSETAVIKLTQELSRIGWDVTVFNEGNWPPEGETVNGVKWRNYWAFNPHDDYDALWVWRHPELFDLPLSARISVLDLHDTMSQFDLTEERLGRIDRVFVKTAYHRSLYPKVPDSKFTVIGNGIDLSRWDMPNVPVREPHRFIYSSTPNRGLDVVLTMWPRIRERLPDAELHVFYGWNTFYRLEKDNPERMSWMKRIQAMASQPGVLDHGRRGQRELAVEQLKSSFWIYPTYFPEIHCITACEMQAAGVIPLTTGFAALAETQKSGLAMPGDPYDPNWQEQFVDAVMRFAGDDGLMAHERAKAKGAAKEFSWEKVAQLWDHEIQRDTDELRPAGPPRGDDGGVQGEGVGELA